MKILLNYRPSPEHRAALEAAAPEAELLIAEDEEAAKRLVAEANAILGNRYFLQSLPHARRLRWMQSNSMGADLILRSGADLSHITLTCARGVYDDEIADHTLALLLALARGVPAMRDMQHKETWDRRPLVTLAGAQALILGWGGIGRAVARRLSAFGMEIAAVRRGHAGPPAQMAVAEDGAGGASPVTVSVYGPDTWRQALPGARFVVMALPLTPETHQFLGAAEIARMRRDAFVVNVGRGESIDEAALLAALREEQLAGAALDVFEEEPLAAGNPAWREPRLLVSPHVARSPEAPPFRWEPLFVENLRRFSAGEPLLHVVDQRRGY